jgi:hypothetical protein
MSRLKIDIQELIEKGMSAKFISSKLNIPVEWAIYEIEEREQLELQKQQEFLNYGEV